MMWKPEPDSWQPPTDRVTRATYDHVVQENKRLVALCKERTAERDQARELVTRLERIEWIAGIIVDLRRELGVMGA